MVFSLFADAKQCQGNGGNNVDVEGRSVLFQISMIINESLSITMTSWWARVTIVIQPFVQAQIKENIKVPRHWPGEFYASPVNSPHKGPVTRKIFPFDDVIMHRYGRDDVIQNNRSDWVKSRGTSSFNARLWF